MRPRDVPVRAPRGVVRRRLRLVHPRRRGACGGSVRVCAPRGVVRRRLRFLHSRRRGARGGSVRVCAPRGVVRRRLLLVHPRRRGARGGSLRVRSPYEYGRRVAWFGGVFGTVFYAVADHLTRRFEYELEFNTGSYAVFHPVRSVTQPSRAVISSLIGVRVGSPKPLGYCVSTCFTKS